MTDASGSSSISIIIWQIQRRAVMSFNFVRLDIKTLKLARVHPEEDVLRYHPKVGHSATRAHSQLKTQQCQQALSTTIEMIGIAVAKASIRKLGRRR